MAESGAEDVALDDRNVSFQNQFQLASEAPGALHEEIAQLELLNTSRQRKEGRRKLCDFLVLVLKRTVSIVQNNVLGTALSHDSVDSY